MLNIHFGRVIRLVSVIVCSSLLSALTLQSVQAFDGEKISPKLASVLERTDKAVPIIVMMQQLPPLPHLMLGQIPPAQIERMIKQQVLKYQAGVREYIRSVAVNGIIGEAPIRNYHFFWNVNALMATTTAEYIEELASREDVAYVTLDSRIRLDPDFRREADLEGAEFTYGLEKIGVPQLRSQNPDVNGQGVTVGILDTGLDPKHAEFEGKAVVFKDFVGNQSTAYDDHGHGTHVAGTISGLGAGGTQIGVAPGINKLVIGKVFTGSGGGSLSGILRGMEWMCDPDGKPETKDQPRVINNSWGGSLGDDADSDPFSPAVLTWVQLNIFPSFAAGNSGPGSSTVGSPGGLPQSFAVGATDESDEIADFSSRGPVDIRQGGKAQHYAKPDVSAPGVGVLSAMPGGEYGKMSGTSMATPHNTGVVALLVQVKPDLTVQQIREVLEKSSQDLGEAGKDNTFGSGRLNVVQAIQTLSMRFGLMF